MPQFVSFLRSYQFLRSWFRDYPGVDMWRFCFHPTSSNRSTSFCYWRLCDMRCEPLVGMCCFCVRVCWLFWRYIWFVNSWRSLLNWGAAACVVLILELRLALFASFWQCWSFQSCFSSDSWHMTLGVIYIRVVPVMRGWIELFRDSSKIELRLCDVIFGRDWLSRHLVVLDCLRARVDIPRADESFIASMLYDEELLDTWADGFLATILMVKDDAQHEMKDLPVICRVWECIWGMWKGCYQPEETFLWSSWTHGQNRFHEARAEMAELKGHIENLAAKDFIRPSISP